MSIERDRARGVLDEHRRGMVVDSVITLIDNLSETEGKPAGVAETAGPEATAQIKPLLKGPRSSGQGRQVLCVGARGNLDDAAASILAQLVERRGIGARVLSWVDAGASPADLARVDIEGIEMVCLLYLNENSIAHARYLIRRLRHRMPEVSILVAFLSLPADPWTQGASRKATKAESVSTSLVDTLDQISAAWRDGDKPPVSAEKAVVGELT